MKCLALILESGLSLAPKFCAWVPSLWHRRMQPAGALLVKLHSCDPTGPLSYHNTAKHGAGRNALLLASHVPLDGLLLLVGEGLARS